MNSIDFSLTLVFIVLLSAGSNAAAQDQPLIPVRLADATQLAMNKRPEIKVENEKKCIAESKVQERKGNFLPTIDLYGTNNYIDNYDQFSGTHISGWMGNEIITVDVRNEVPAYQVRGQLELKYNLFAGGRDKALLNEAENNLNSVEQQKTLAKRKIQLEVARAYWELKKAQVELAITKRENEIVKWEEKVAQTEIQVHRMSDLEYEAILLKKNEKLMGLKKKTRDCLNALRNYFYALGIPQDDMDLAKVRIPDLIDDPGVETGLAEASSVHPDILRLRSDLQAAVEKVKTEKAGHYPTIDFIAEYSCIGRDDEEYLEAWNDSESAYFKVGLTLSMNIFNGNRTTARIAQAKAQMRKQKLQLDLKIRQLEHMREIKKTVLDTAKDELHLAIERKRLEDSRRKTAESEFKAHRISEMKYMQKVIEAENAADKVILTKIDVVLARNEKELLILE